MPGPEARRPEKFEAALEAIEGPLRSGRAGADACFDQLCARHPDLKEELRKIQSVFQLAQAAASSRSLQEALREELGDLAELTVELAEESAPPARPESARNKPPAAAGMSGPCRRYSVENEVARGGMGIIWRVRDNDLSRTLAMKVMASSVVFLAWSAALLFRHAVGRRAA
jgi:hypothetical protein